MDFGVVKVDLGFNKAIQSNGFAASSMEFADNKTEIGAGARVVVPVEGLLNVDALFKMYMKNVDGTDSGDATKMTFGAIVDGHSNSENGSDTTLTSAVDVRFQYNMDKMGFALHNNATFGKNEFANKTNLGFMYGLTDAATLFVEVQNYLAKLENVRFVTKAGEVDTLGFVTKAGEVDTLADVVTVYPRFAFGIAEGVTLKTGLRADFGLTEDFKQLEIALPLSMEVIF